MSECRFTKRTLIKMVVALVKLVQIRISEEMKSSKIGAIMHDGWTRNGVHYVGVFACYVRLIDVSIKGRKVESEEVVTTLLDVAPMGNISIDEDEDNKYSHIMTHETAVNFNADTHVHFLKKTFDSYNIDMENWVVASIADNCSTNKCVSDLFNIPHISFNSHKINLEVNKIIDTTQSFKNTIDSIHNTMKSCKVKLKNADILQNLTDLKPMVHNKTRWSSKYYMLECFVRIRDKLVEAAEHSDADIDINVSDPFHNKVMKYAECMKEINQVAVALQERNWSLSTCRDMLKLLLENISSHKATECHPFYQFMMGDRYIGDNAEIIHSKDFENGVYKIKRNMSIISWILLKKKPAKY